MTTTTTVDRYAFNGLYCPRAADFLPEKHVAQSGGVPDPGRFLEACCVRLERLFPDVPHVANLVTEMRKFAKHELIAEFPELDWPGQARHADLGLPISLFDASLPE